MKKLLLATTAVLGLAAAPGIAHATYMGNVFSVTQDQAANAAPPVPPAGATQIAHFTTTNDSLNFSSPPGAYTPTGFLNNGGVTCVDNVAGGCAQTMNNTLWDITGTATVTTGQMFSITHDDGITLIIDGMTVINSPGATPPIVNNGTYNGPSGNQSVELIYGEAFGPPAELIGTLPTEVGVPEPATLALLGSALLGFGALRRRRRTS